MQPSSRRRLVGALVLGVVFAAAAAVRLRLLLLAGGPFFFGAYDDGVHFTAALNLVHGHLPYRDVLFLQPPGVVLATSPFAALAPLVGDARAFVLARIAFALIGAANALLVAAVLRRWGAVAALTGGLLYAVSWPAVYDERTTSLEVLGTTGVLGAVLLLRLQDRRPRWALLAGVAAGAAIGFKIWYVVPFVILAVAAGRRVLPFLLGGAAGGCAVYLPFFIPAPALMWRDVVTSQLGRPVAGADLWQRTRSILGVDTATPHRPPWQVTGDVGVDVLLGVLAVMLVLTLLTPGARLFAALLAGSAAVLLLAPSYFQHYAALTAGPLALVGGTGAARIAAALRRRWTAVLAVVVAVALALGVNLAQVLDDRNQKPVPRAALQAESARIPGCFVADDPTVLILIGRVSTDLDRGCTVQADPSGQGYVLGTAQQRGTSRRMNPVFQREVLRYLRSAQAYLLVRGDGLGLSPASQAAVDADPVLYRVDGFVVRTGR